MAGSGVRLSGILLLNIKELLFPFDLQRHNSTSKQDHSAALLAQMDAPTKTVNSFAERLALAGFLLYAAFAPHSIAGAEMGLLLVGVGWLARTLKTRRFNIRRTPLDLPILLFFIWTAASALLSAEPRVSLPKLQSVCVLFLFYLTRSILTRRTAMMVAVLMIVSGCAGALWSLWEIAHGRGVIVAAVADHSPFRARPIRAGDAVWRIGGSRVSSVQEIDEAIKRTPAGTLLSISLITQGEHVEWASFVVTDEMKAQPSPSGLTGAGRTHRFRASGWTRHYETFSETLQILAQLALGLALANWQNPGLRRKRKGTLKGRALLALAAYALLAVGVALTAMRTVLVALAIGGGIIAWRVARKRARLLILVVLASVLALGALVVWRTRASQALSLQDPSASLRWRVARVALRRVAWHPFFGHGMDAVQRHWTEWGFPGTEMIHAHSTPIQLAFDRGVPALLFWLWIIGVFWLMTARAEKSWRHSDDVNRHGLLLGATGAVAGFFASSLVNYNFGDGEVALVFWWLMGTVVVLAREDIR